VTRQIAQLEGHFGVRLLHRTTRKLSLTDEGLDLVTRARHLLEEAEELEERFGKNHGSAVGLVRIGMTVGAAMLLTPEIPGLLQRHPGLSIDLVVSERPDDLVAERLDIGLRFGASEDSSMVSRGLAVVGSAPVAAPSYLEKYGAPAHPRELAEHICIVHDRGPDSAHWVFNSADGNAVNVEVTSAFRSNNPLVVRQAAVTGYGIAMLGEPLILNEIRAGRLYRLLPDYTVRDRQAFLVYPSRRFLPQRTRVVIDFLVEQFRTTEARLRDGRAWGENESTWLV
jgi:DNA-binding transcriptional LysR family regulator